MPRRRPDEAARLRQHNEEMKLALAENVTVLEARRLLAARRWREFEAAMERRQRCGTSATEKLPAHHVGSPVPPPAQHREPYWWERD